MRHDTKQGMNIENGAELSSVPWFIQKSNIMRKPAEAIDTARRCLREYGSGNNASSPLIIDMPLVAII